MLYFMSSRLIFRCHQSNRSPSATITIQTKLESVNAAITILPQLEVVSLGPKDQAGMPPEVSRRSKLARSNSVFLGRSSASLLPQTQYLLRLIINGNYDIAFIDTLGTLNDPQSNPSSGKMRVPGICRSRRCLHALCFRLPLSVVPVQAAGFGVQVPR